MAATMKSREWLDQEHAHLTGKTRKYVNERRNPILFFPQFCDGVDGVPGAPVRQHRFQSRDGCTARYSEPEGWEWSRFSIHFICYAGEQGASAATPRLCGTSS